jgi:hypothetical protein
MALIKDQSIGTSNVAGASIGEMLDKNVLTTAGVLVGAGTGVAGAAVLTVALPAQVLGASVISAGLIYAGDRQSKGLKIFANPFGKPEDQVAEEATTEPAAA